MDTVPALGGTKQGVNDFGRVGYGGPMPPRGHGVHHYHFRLYALDTVLAIQPRATKKQLDEAMKGHILAQIELVGTYQRN
jgi:Raf kinase inhibitor-like YbhB/YbcL family protein